MTLHILDVVEDKKDYRAVGVAVVDAQLANTLRFDPGVGGGVLPAAGGPYVALDADNKPIRSSGTGADAGLRGDLAAPDGSSLSGYIPDATASARSLKTKIREIEVSIADYANGGADAGSATTSALSVIGATVPARLVIPRGAWTIGSNVDWSAYRNVTFVFRPGAVIDQGANTVVLPERVSMAPGARFAGVGGVTIRNKDEQPLTTPPGGYVRTGNDARGLRAAVNLTKGTNNLAWGTDALASATTARSSIAIGNEALKSVTGSANASSAYGTFMGIGDGNLAIGDSVLRDCTTGYENTGVGMYNMQRLTTGRWNVCLGVQNLILNTTGSCNIAIGPYASVTYTGENSIAIGFGVLENHNSGSNLAIGYVAMNGSLTSARMTVVGAQGAEKLQDGTDGVVIGQEAMRNAVHAEGVTVVGAYALGRITTGGCTNTTSIGRNSLLMLESGDGNTAVGAGALSLATTVVGSAGLGQNAQVTGSNQVQIGGSGTTTYTYGAVQDRSDLRDKADIRDTTLGLAFIRALRPVDFRWDMRDDYRAIEPPPTAPTLINPRPNSDRYEEDAASDEAALSAYRDELDAWSARQRLAVTTRDGSKKRQRFHHGVIAQEVKALIDGGVIEDFGGFQDHSVNGGDDVMSIGYEELIGPLIKAVQELSARLEALEAK